MMSANFDFKLITADTETPEAHKQLVMRVIHELCKSLREKASGPGFWGFWQHHPQQPASHSDL